MFRASALVVGVTSIVRTAFIARHIRVRKWGRLPLRRGPTVLIANHQHEDESEIVVERTWLDGPWHKPVYSIGSRRMFEPGFFAQRLPWTAGLSRHWNPGDFLRLEGFLPLENQLASRPLSSLADEIRHRHGDLRLDEVLDPAGLTAFGAAAKGARLSGLWHPPLLARGETMVKLAYLRQPYRREALNALRATIDADLANLGDTVRGGATLYVTPEGEYSRDGRLGPLRGVLAHVLPAGEAWLAAISFDVFGDRRLSMLYRVQRPADPADLATSLAAARPVTTSGLLAAFLAARGDEPFAAAEAVRAVRAGLEELPPGAFADPELRAAPERTAMRALALLCERGTLVCAASTYRCGAQRGDPHFPKVGDMVAYQATFLAETLAAARRLAER